jgi:hypothetical protein
VKREKRKGKIGSFIRRKKNVKKENSEGERE